MHSGGADSSDHGLRDNFRTIRNLWPYFTDSLCGYVNDYSPHASNGERSDLFHVCCGGEEILLAHF